MGSARLGRRTALAAVACLLAVPVHAQIVSIDAIQTYNPATGAPASPYHGQTVTVEGALYVLRGTFNAGSHYLQGADGGLQFYTTTAPAFARGDRVRVTGVVNTFLGEIQIGVVSEVTLVEAGAEPAPRYAALGDLRTDFEWVGNFVYTQGFVVEAPTGATDRQFRLHDGAGDTVVVHVDNDTGIDTGAIAPGDCYEVRAPAVMVNGAVRLKPREQADLVPIPAGGLLNVADAPGDEGGWLSVGWPRHALEEATGEARVTHYAVERFAQGWQEVASVPASLAATYEVTVATDDVATAGEPSPVSAYRVLARTDEPRMFYPYQPVEGCSIDNLAPDAPHLVIHDGEDFRWVLMQVPAVADLDESCLYRGEEPGFVASEPVRCAGEESWYWEEHRGLCWYRARCADVHGNVSEWSNEVRGTYPTGAPDRPAALRLGPNRPNPFNPRTTILFELPAAGRARLDVYDARGRMVRRLVAADLPAGLHRAVWDGRDGAGRPLPSGQYVACLEAAGQVRTLRMGLVR